MTDFVGISYFWIKEKVHLTKNKMYEITTSHTLGVQKEKSFNRLLRRLSPCCDRTARNRQ